jgi:hypothetical protein
MISKDFVFNIDFFTLVGVAPRAKMNQQRQRRFRTAKAREDFQKMSEHGEKLPETTFDSNCITPGTEFMQELTKHIKFFIRKKLKEDPAWRKVTIIFSGHEVLFHTYTHTQTHSLTHSNFMNLLSFFDCHLYIFFCFERFLEKENTRSWTLLDDLKHNPITIQIKVIVCMDKTLT